MNPVQLLEHFDRISEAPDAVARLRRFILDLAVRGKLVEQDSNDEPASELFKRIQAVKSSNVAGTRKQAVITKVGNSDVLFPAPLGWLWLRFGLVHDLVRGVTYTKSDVAETQVADYLPILRANNIGASLNFDDLVFVRQECIGPDQMLRRGDYLIALSSGSKNLVGKAAFVDADHPCGFGGFCGVIRLISPPSLEQFVGVFLSSRLYRDAISAGSRGIGINNLKRETLNEALFPLPPLAEQHRIVAKVDELMALCDQLEAAKNEREARRDRLVAASLHRIGTAPAAADEGATKAQSATPLRDAARFHLDHLPRLTTRREHIKQLRQTILNLAVRGRLVPQDPNEEAAAELLKQRVPEKNDATPFLIPATWVWVTAGEIAKTRLGKMLDKAKNKGTPRRYLRNVNVRWFDFNLSDVLEMRFEDSELDEFALYEGDVLICEGGEPGRAAVWDAREDGIYFQKAIHRLRFPQGVNPHYFVSAIREAADSSRLATYFTGVGIKHFTGKGLASFLFPLPPLAEQHRIVAKVDELMALCNQLEAQLTATQTDSRRLLEAVLHEALDAALEKAA